MSKEKKIITLIACLLLIIGFSILSWFIFASREINYISFISHSVDTSTWNVDDRFMYYWSDSEKVNDADFESTVWVGQKPLVLSYNITNQEPQDIFLHTKLIKPDDSQIKSYTFKNYINKLLSIELESKQPIATNNSDLIIPINSNTYTKIDAIYVQLSENALTSETPLKKLKYRYLGIFDGKESHKYELKLNLEDFNVIDGAYYLKLIVRDTAGVITEVYSDKLDINFDVISKLIQFDTPIVGNDGQILVRSNVHLTGNTLIESHVSNTVNLNTKLETNSCLTLSENIDDDTKLNIRKLNGNKMSDIKLKRIAGTNQYQVETDVLTPNDWYYLYYDDEFIGVFLYQSNRLD